MSRVQFTDDLLAAIRAGVDLADLVGRYLPLKRAGKSWKACCPFHQEKTPSFHVHPESGVWKCYGCGKGGNAFHFLMEREGLSFPEAVRQLAREAGVALPSDDDPGAAEEASRLARLREVMERACRFYERSLRAPDGESARAYLARRGLRDDTVTRFRLGWAPGGWQALIDAAREGGVADDDLVDLGLARRKEPEEGRPARFFDMFRERVTFPICDTQGRVIAFGARTLGDDEPKYLNSPESPLFSKGRTVYALHLAKQEMLKTGEGAVMEGYTDVILAHQCGWPVAVAGLGTALTPEQATLIARYVKRVHLVYDGDAAGQRAAEKNAPVFLPQDVETRVAVLPAGEDPCDTLVRGGLPALKACLAEGREAFDHLLAAKAAAHDMDSVPGKAQALDEALAVLLPVASEVKRALYLKRLADAYAIQEEVVWGRFKELRAGSAAARAARPPAPRPAESAPRTGEPPAATERAAAAPAPAGPPPAVEAQLVEALLGCPRLCAEAAERLPRDAVRHPLCRALLDRLLDRFEETGTAPSTDSVLAGLEDPALAGFAAELAARARERTPESLERQARDCLARLEAAAEFRGLQPGLDELARPEVDRRALAADEGEVLRRLVELHRRRAGAS